ncbi:hypothetical protein JJB61_10395 [Clostridium perfringens]|uniref:Lipoprotein n=1 Tax=Clostridium perfringens TaxID=1502 RepID=A0AB35S2H2_CLOPF|nr:hypothetical protein [Clostridium perfringens]ASY52608.1 hypothetical protein BG908_13435 [Clostridium perfringens]AWS24187.1 hypothetical protein CYK96_00545 [Clostridium perfringens]EJT6477381.1 hypothetical protein [Clostridium perfringens]MBO3338258.1 hypothetical protein [Clostridium perfringens]MBO3385421.1 hypothetical protein [Clostridium perfringens]
MDNIEIIISIFSLLVSICAVIYANSASKTANKVANGEIELNIFSIIRETEIRVMDLTIELSKFEDYESLSQTKKKECDAITKAFEQAIESNLNAYEEACAKYLDGKIDIDRFSRMYNTPIRNLVENDEYQDYFKPIISSYKCILKVYEKWNNLEK